MVVEYTADKNGYYPQISYEPNKFSVLLEKDSSFNSDENSNDASNCNDDSCDVSSSSFSSSSDEETHYSSNNNDTGHMDSYN